MLRRVLHVTMTLVVMLVVSRFLIRIVDATVQIDDDLGMLVLMLVMVNAAIAVVSYRMHRARGSRCR